MNMQSPNTTNPHIASLATATPPHTVSQDILGQLAHKHYKDRLSPRSLALIRSLFCHPSIRERSFAIDNVENLVDEDLDARIVESRERVACELREQAICADATGWTSMRIVASSSG